MGLQSIELDPGLRGATPTELEPPDLGRSRRWPWLVAFTLATVLVILIPPVGAACLCAMLTCLLPIGRNILTRLIFGVGLGVVMSHCAVLLGVSLTHGGTRVALVLCVLLLLIAVLAFPRLPRIRAGKPETLVLGAAACLGVIAVLPAIGASPEQLVSMQGTGWDNNTHFTLFANTWQYGASPWPSPDGSAPMLDDGPSAYYSWLSMLTALFTSGTPTARTDLLWPYLLTTGITAGLCVALLGFVAVDLARRIARALQLPDAPLWCAVGFGLASTFGDLMIHLVNIGHTPFLLTVALTTSTAWIIWRSRASRRALAWLAAPMGIWVGWQVWLPLALTVVGALLAFYIQWARNRLWAYALLVGGCVLGVFAATRLTLKAGGLSLPELAVLSGANAGFNLMVVMAGLPACVALAFLVPGLERPTRFSLGLLAAPLVGFALAMGATAQHRGVPWGASYYTIKALNGASLTLAPLLWSGIGVAAAVVMSWVTARSNSSRERAAGVAFLLLLLVIPVGYAGPGAMSMKPDMPIAAGVYSVRVRQALSAGPTGPQAMAAFRTATQSGTAPAVMLDQPDALVNRWQATLAGGYSTDLDNLFGQLAAATDTPARVAAVRVWLQAHPGARLNLLCQSPEACSQARNDPELATLADQLSVSQIGQ